MADRYNLDRFVRAQDPVFGQVCSELGGGRKNGHWMWFVFPQIRGLGHSQMANEFAISGREEAEAYLKHAILGPRLKECTRLVVLLEGIGIRDIFGYPDYLKFRSCMTLFVQVASENQIFKDALQKYFEDEPDHRTLERL
jgi:uncharacterized protein (DUF1810 family)